MAWEPLLWRRKILAKLPLKAGQKPLLALSEVNFSSFLFSAFSFSAPGECSGGKLKGPQICNFHNALVLGSLLEIIAIAV